jgi:type III secretion protein J
MKQRMMTIGLCLLLGACGEQELYGQLNQRQANDMVAVLRSEGIAAEKLPSDGGNFSVTVPKDNFSKAVDVLRASGYPREGYDTLGKVFKKEGFVSSPLEERARLTHALSQEIANTISSIDGVVMSRVHLSVPEKDPLSDKTPPSAASVFIKHRANVDLQGQTSHIKALVVNAIQGLSYDNITVAFFQAEASPVQTAAMATPRGSWGSFALGAVALGGVGLLVFGAYFLWQRRRSQAALAAQAQSATVHVLSTSARG